MSAENETIGDIRQESEAKLRDELKKMFARPPDPLRVLRSFNDMFDRIEAAAKYDAAIHAMTCEANERLREHLEIALKDNKRPVGNGAAMHEALCEIVLLTVKAGMSISCGVACGIIASKAKHALKQPPRNCDRFGGDIDKLREACARERGLNPEEDFPDVFPDWLLAPSTAKESEAET